MICRHLVELTKSSAARQTLKLQTLDFVVIVRPRQYPNKFKFQVITMFERFEERYSESRHCPHVAELCEWRGTAMRAHAALILNTYRVALLSSCRDAMQADVRSLQISIRSLRKLKVTSELSPCQGSCRGLTEICVSNRIPESCLVQITGVEIL